MGNGLGTDEAKRWDVHDGGGGEKGCTPLQIHVAYAGSWQKKLVAYCCLALDLAAMSVGCKGLAEKDLGAKEELVQLGIDPVLLDERPSQRSP